MPKETETFRNRFASGVKGEKQIPSFDESQINNHISLFGTLLDRGGFQKGLSGEDRFAFAVHPRTIEDGLKCFRLGPTDLGFLSRFISPNYEQGLKNAMLYTELAKIPPFLIGKSDITVEGFPVKGKLLAILLYAEQMLERRGWRRFAQERIVEGLLLAKDQGVRLVGLGSHTSPAVLGGELFFDHDGNLKDEYIKLNGVGVTNGNALTAVSAKEAVIRGLNIIEKPANQSKVAVVGATGSVGHVTSQLLAKEGFNEVMLIGTSEQKVRNDFPELKETAQFSGQLSDIKDSDIVVIATNINADGKFDHRYVTPGTWIVNMTQPNVLSRNMVELLFANGSISMDGGSVRIPGYQDEFSLGFPSGVSPACLSETTILAMARQFTNFCIGRPSLKQAETIDKLAKRFNVELDSPSYEGKYLSEADFDKVRSANYFRKSIVHSLS